MSESGTGVGPASSVLVVDWRASRFSTAAGGTACVEAAVCVPVVGGDGRVRYVPLPRAPEAGASVKAKVLRAVGPRDGGHTPASSQPENHEPAPSSRRDPYDSEYGTVATAPGEDAHLVLRLRGGGSDPDIIDDWETVSYLRYRRRSSALQEIDRAVRQWRVGGYQEPELLERNERELRAILEAIKKWRNTKTDGSKRIDAIDRLQQRVTEELQGISDTLAIDFVATQASESAAQDSGDAGNRQDGNRPAATPSQRRPVMAAVEWDEHYVAGRGWRSVSPAEMRLFEQRVGPANGRRLLDVGCGDGGYAAELHRLGFGVLGVDYAPTGIDTALERHGGRDGLDFAVLDIDRDDPAALGRFDVITCRMVYAFLDRPRFLATARRLLNAGGVLHITTPHADRSHMPGNKPGIGIGEQDIAALCDGWATWSRYDLDYLTCIVCKLPASPHSRSDNALAATQRPVTGVGQTTFSVNNMVFDSETAERYDRLARTLLNKASRRYANTVTDSDGVSWKYPSRSDGEFCVNVAAAWLK